jgi:hypothetical protein
MILSDREIKAALARKAISITPEPRDERFASTSVDLTLDGVLRRWKKPAGGAKLRFCPAEKDFNFTDLTNQHSDAVEIAADGTYPLQPGEFVLGWTVEKIQFPHRSRIAARVEGKSSLGAPTAHCPGDFLREKHINEMAADVPRALADKITDYLVTSRPRLIPVSACLRCDTVW